MAEYDHVWVGDICVRCMEGAQPAEPSPSRHAVSERHFAFCNGIRRAIQWLHDRATHDMNDPHAKAVLNTAAFHLGIALGRGDFRKPSRAATPNSIIDTGSPGTGE
jgi:hypothetical protein